MLFCLHAFIYLIPNFNFNCSRRAKALANDDIDELDKVDKAIEKLEHEIRMEKVD